MVGYFLAISFGVYIQNMEIIINKIAMWKATFHKGYTVRIVPAGTRYQNQANIFCVSDKKMYRYAKNYMVGKTEYCLFVRSFEDDKDGIEKQLDKVAKTITETQAKKAIMASADNFEYLDKYLKGDK